MKSITLMTKVGLEYGKLHEQILGLFKGYKIFEDEPKDGFGRIYLYKGDRAIDLEFSPKDVMSEFAHEFEPEQLQSFPFDAHLTSLDFKDRADAALIVALLLAEHEELYIHDEDGSIVSAQSWLSK